MLCQQCHKNRAMFAVCRTSFGKSYRRLCCGDCLVSLCADGRNGEVQSLDPNVKVCPQCGMTMEEFGRTGLVGCERCYSVFGEELSPYIRRMQGTTVHVSPDRERRVEQDEKQACLNELRAQMSLALRQNDFESAEIVHAQIKALCADLREEGS